MTQENLSGDGIAERIETTELAVGDGSPVTAMLANSLAERKPLADDGALHDTVQGAVDAATGFVFVPPGTFNESVTISTDGLMLMGSGDGTLIDGGTSGAGVNIAKSNISVRNMKVQSSANSSFDGVFHSGGISVLVENVTVTESGDNGIAMTNEAIVRNCTVKNTGDRGLTSGDKCIISNNTVDNAGSVALTTGSDSIVSNNIVKNTNNNGIQINGDDTVAIGNRSINNERGLITFSNDNIFANNRLSDNSSSDITDAGTGTVLDGNLTGPSN